MYSQLQENKAQPPMRTGILDFLRGAAGTQFVIPVYQRSYTWTANKEVRQMLEDLKHVLVGDYKNHFLGIMIYLDKPIDYSAREFSVIDGQQRLTTFFLILYAIKAMFDKAGMTEAVKSLEGQYLTNPFSSAKLKYKLKPLVADDEVYQHIVSNEMDKIEDKNSNVYKNYVYISEFLQNLIMQYTLNDILMALNKLYIVCVPISSEDNAQKIFESINATGVKLTASDLIRNFVLMDLSSEQQEAYYETYWKKLEDFITDDAKKLESFFRFFLAAKNKDLPNKNAVYKLFVKWFEQNIDTVGTEGIFKEIVKYAEYHAIVYRKKLSEIEKELQQPLKEFRNIASDMPAPMFLELLNMESKKIITAEQVGSVIDLTNTYLIRRALCSLDTSSITRLFPSLLKNVIEDCKGDYSNILEIFKKNLINKNRGNAMYMPDEQQLKEAVINANMYNIRTTTRLFFDKLELHNNSAPVDLTALSVEHLMPQTPTGEWYAELGIDEDTYQRNLHRLGNLTLATKVDNSIMKNKVWKYKNAVLEKTGHLTINKELLKIDHWNIDEIDKRTVELINQINMLYPYTPSSLSMASRVDIQITANDIMATGHLDLDNGSVEIDAGSEAVPAKHLSETQYQDDLRQELLEAEVLAETEKGYKFIKPYTFYTKYVNSTALSQSAGFLLCGSRNGWDYWLDDNGKSLGENQELRKKLS